jgi:hypothetical protein
MTFVAGVCSQEQHMYCCVHSTTECKIPWTSTHRTNCKALSGCHDCVYFALYCSLMRVLTSSHGVNDRQLHSAKLCRTTALRAAACTCGRCTTAAYHGCLWATSSLEQLLHHRPLRCSPPAARLCVCTNTDAQLLHRGESGYLSDWVMPSLVFGQAYVMRAVPFHA